MQKLFNFFFIYPFILILALILVFFTPQSLFAPGENRERAIVIAIGLDKNEDEYEISFLTFIPTPNQEFKQTNSVVSGIGSSISEALLDAQLTLGKDIGLSHAKTTIVSEKMLENDISPSLDYLSRVVSLPENTVFVCTNSSAKDLLKATSSLEENLGLKLDQLISYNANEVYVSDTSLEAFYQGYYSEERASIIGYLEYVEEENSQSQSASGGASDVEGDSANQKDKASQSLSSSQTEGTQGEEKERGSINGQSQILNNGEAVLLKKGKKVAILNIDNLNSINLLNNKKSLDCIKINQVKTEDDKTVDMVFEVKNKYVNIATKIQNKIPIFIADVNLGLKLTEIDTKGQEVKSNTQFTEINQEIASKIESKIKIEFSQMLQILRENKADVINVYDTFFRQNRKQFLDFYNNLDDKEDYLNSIIFMLNVRLQPDG